MQSIDAKHLLLLHDTNNIVEILKSQILYKSSDIKSVRGQGSLNRRLATDPTISLKDEFFYEHYDEVDGVYFRLLDVSTPLRIEYGNSIIILSSTIFNDIPFVFNTTENFGFNISHEGTIGESQFSGDEGMTISSVKNFKLLENVVFDPYASEVVILNNVTIAKYAKYIFIKQGIKNKDLIFDLCHKLGIPIYTLN